MARFRLVLAMLLVSSWCGFFIGAVVIAPVTRSLLSGPLAVIPKTCEAGALYTATDQPLGQQIYVCGGGNAWFQLGSLGHSGGLVIVKGVLDTSSMVPLLYNANTYMALQTLQAGLSLKTKNTMPLCTDQADGIFWHQSGNTNPINSLGVAVPLTKDTISACVFNGKSYNWVTLY